MLKSRRGGLSPMGCLLLPLAALSLMGGVYVGSLFANPPSRPSIGTNAFLKRRAVDDSESAPTNPVVPTEKSHLRGNIAKGSGNISKDTEKVSDLTKPSMRKGSFPIAESKHAMNVDEFLTESFYADDGAYVELSSSFDSVNEHLLVALWARMDCKSSVNTMRTLFSNKASGCNADAAHYGLALFVNEWQTSNHLLYVEYGSPSSGCHKINTQVLIECDKWTHFAVHSTDMHIIVYVDGLEVKREVLNQPRNVQMSNPMIIGRYDSSQYPFEGNISRFVIANILPGVNISPILMKLMAIDGTTPNGVNGLKGFFQLPSNKAAKKSTKIINTIGGIGGFYHVAFSGTDIISGFALGDVHISEDITQTMKTSSDLTARIRRDKIRDAMLFVWNSYRQYAWGQDELKPVSKTGSQNWGGMGVTLVDSLDTLWLMGLHKEFDEAKKWVQTSLTFDHAGAVSVFETTIRELGGLLSAYDLSGDKVFLDKAKLLGDRLMPAFASGVACSTVNIGGGGGGQCTQGGAAVLSEMGTLQVEFRYLAHHTGNKEYERASMRGLQILNHVHAPNGLYPIRINSDGSFASSQITFGALGDSFYEYLLKTWIQGGKKEDWLRKMYDNAMDGMVKVLLKISSPSRLAYISDFNGASNDLKMDHLVCFMPATLALGALTNPNGMQSERAIRDLSIAKGLMNTCYQMYKRMPSGLSPEYVTFAEGRDFQVGNAPYYILRPETAESLFYMHQITGDPIYREWAWEIFEAINSHCKTDIGYAALRDVNNAHSGVDDRMESFFLAETMKYLYLVQDPDNTMDLTKYVFNTEAHPLKIFDSSHVPVEP